MNHDNPAPHSRARVLQLARAWLGTPYHHQASAFGAGCDCVGLVRGVYRSLYGREAEPLPGYSRDWAEATGAETLIASARRHLIEIDPAAAKPADVLVFRYRPRLVAKHTGILAASPSSRHCTRRGEGRPRTLDPGEGRPLAGHVEISRPHASSLTLIHALEGAPVSEVPFSPWWQRRIAAAFSFPGIID